MSVYFIEHTTKSPFFSAHKINFYYSTKISQKGISSCIHRNTFHNTLDLQGRNSTEPYLFLKNVPKNPFLSHHLYIKL